MSERLFQFASTEHADAVGRTMPLSALPLLVKTYLEAERELEDLRPSSLPGITSREQLQQFLDEAARHQLLREGIEAFLKNHFSVAESANRKTAVGIDHPTCSVTEEPALEWIEVDTQLGRVTFLPVEVGGA